MAVPYDKLFHILAYSTVFRTAPEGNEAPLLQRFLERGRSNFGAPMNSPAVRLTSPQRVAKFGGRSITPMSGEVERGDALCGSGIGTSIAANKVPGCAPLPDGIGAAWPRYLRWSTRQSCHRGAVGSVSQ